MKPDPNVVAAAVAEGIERRTSIVETLRALKGEPYATTIGAVAQLTYCINSIVSMANAGAVHPAAVGRMAALVNTMQHATAILSVLADTTKPPEGVAREPRSQAYLDALTADVNAILRVASDANAKIYGSEA